MLFEATRTGVPAIDSRLDAETPAIVPIERSGSIAARYAPAFSTDAYRRWVDLVQRINRMDASGMEELYRVLSKGIRYYIRRRMKWEDADDRVHDVLVIVTEAIRSGDLRDPARLMGFVTGVARRQIAQQIRADLKGRERNESDEVLPDQRRNPEDSAIFEERKILVRRVLDEMSSRDRDILSRFYLQNQSQEQICREMKLTETQFRLLKSRAKARFVELGRKKLRKNISKAIPSESF